jgi:hypothetical protein
LKHCLCCVIVALALQYGFGCPAYSQPAVRVGIKTGVQLTDQFLVTPATGPRRSFSQYSVNETRFVIGVTGQIGLPWSMIAEVDALYRPLVFTRTDTDPLGITTRDTKAKSWEFPILIRRTVAHLGSHHRFAGIGFSARHVSGTTDVHEFGPAFTPPISIRSTTAAADLTSTWSTGLVASGGIDVQLGRFHLLPEVRYTRWVNDNFRTMLPYCNTCATIRSNRSRFEARSPKGLMQTPGNPVVIASTFHVRKPRCSESIGEGSGAPRPPASNWSCTSSPPRTYGGNTAEQMFTNIPKDAIHSDCRGSDCSPDSRSEVSTEREYRNGTVTRLLRFRFVIVNLTRISISVSEQRPREFCISRSSRPR